MSIFDTIMALTGRKDPVEKMKDAIMRQGGGASGIPNVQPGGDAGGQPVPGTDPNTTQSTQQAPIPNAYKSPPDLSQMYLELTERDRNAREMDQGMTLIAAGLARDENRNRIMSTYDQNGQTSMDPSMFTAINAAQEAQQAALMKNQMRLALPAIAKQYGWSTEAVNMMFEAGTLEEAIKQASQPHYVEVKRKDGSTAYVDVNELQRETPGGTVNPAAAPVPTTPPAPVPSIPAVAEDQTPVPLLRDDMETAAAAPPVTEPTVPGTTPPAVAEPGIQVAAAPPKKVTFQDDPSSTGQLAFYEDGTPAPEFNIVGGEDLQIEKTADGRFQAIDKNTGKAFGDPYGAPEDTSTENQKEYAQFAAAQKARGEKPADYDVWYDTYKRYASPQGTANWDPAARGGKGQDLGDPGVDHQWVRDENGAVKRDPETGLAISAATPGSKADIEAKAAAAAGEARVANAQVQGNFVINDIDRALVMAEENKDNWLTPATGFMSQFTAGVGGTPAGDTYQLLQGVKASIGLEKLQQIRDASKTGAALGPVSDFENRLLQSTYGSLEQSQSHEQFVENLKRVKAVYSAIITTGLKPDDPRVKEWMVPVGKKKTLQERMDKYKKDKQGG